MCVIKQALRNGVDPVSERALMFEPRRTRHFTTGSLPETHAHQRGVTQWTDRSSGTSYNPFCSLSASHTVIKYSVIYTLPRRHAMKSGEQPSLVRFTTSFRIFLGSRSKRSRSPCERREFSVHVLHSCSRSFPICSKVLCWYTCFDAGDDDDDVVEFDEFVVSFPIWSSVSSPDSFPKVRCLETRFIDAKRNCSNYGNQVYASKMDSIFGVKTENVN